MMSSESAESGMEAGQSLLLVQPGEEGGRCRLDEVVAFAAEGFSVKRVSAAGELPLALRKMREDRKESGTPRRILFAVELGENGINIEYVRLLRMIRDAGPDLFSGFVGAVIVDAASELYTKSTATELVFSANAAGCAFIGKPLVEGTGSLRNFQIAAKNLGTDDLMEAYRDSARKMVQNLMAFCGYRKEQPRLTVLHASSHRTSNTFALWEKVRENLSGVGITEIGLRNGTLSDCAGCPYKTCLHYGERESCFYGGVMVENVYPAVRAADAILMISPNYNDALSANLTAFINRLTALYRKRQFYDKALFAIVVSGYSGSDIVARQLISALCMNKSFYLPAHFALLETANDPGTAVRLPGIAERCRALADNIMETIKL